MRVAALYDVHGNLPALEAVLADVEREGVDRIVFGGDVVSGIWPAETLERVLGLGDRALFVLGNADRDLEPWRRERLGDAGHELVLSWPLTVTLDIDGIGRTLFCHATPRSDEEILTELSPESRWRDALAGTDESVVLCGHIHVQSDREVAGRRVVNAGSVGMPYEGRPGAYWALLGPDVELRRTEYDLAAAAARILATGFPGAEEHVEENVLASPAREEAIAYFEELAAEA